MTDHRNHHWPTLPVHVAGQMRKMVRDTRHTHGPVLLSGPERRLLNVDTRHRQTDNERPSRTMQHRMQRATDTWIRDIGWTVTGLVNATCTIPPASRPSVGRTTGPSDPVAAQLHATLDQVDRATVKLAHLTGPCDRHGLRFNHDGDETADGRLHECPDGHPADIADLSGLVLDPEQIIDAILGTPPTSPAAYADALASAAGWHAATAGALHDRWRTWWQQGAEPSLLEGWTSATEQLVRRISALAGELAQWTDRQEGSRCKHGCGGMVEAGRRECGACRNRNSRQAAG
jgi:hypothetical protein